RSFYYCSRVHSSLPFFPTRRSSDLFPRRRSLSALQRTLLLWLAVGFAGFVLVPWYSVQDSLLGISWIRDFTAKDNAPAILQSLRSEEHTSELQSLAYLVCRLLLEKT